MAATREKRGKKKLEEDAGTDSPSKMPNIGSNLRLSGLFKSATQGQTTEPAGLIQSALFGAPEKSLVTIGSLIPGNYRNSTLCGRVSLVSDIRFWGNSQRQGQTLTFHLLDATGEIAISLFDAQIASFGNIAILNSVIEVSGFTTKVSNPKFRRIPGQEIEGTLDYRGTLTSSIADSPLISFDFCHIPEILQKDAGATVDLIGIVYEREELISGGLEKPFVLRKITVTDRSKYELKIKLWGRAAETFELTGPTAFIIRRGKLEEYQGEKCISVGHTSLFWLNPNLPEANNLMEWLESEIK